MLDIVWLNKLNIIFDLERPYMTTTKPVWDIIIEGGS